ncbi:hypothetical protein FQA39_LY00890 [Lamprigera yunnana]|nr:hypothetical protein FQA39_LY00890 [Lamprigera yunnana]
MHSQGNNLMAQMSLEIYNKFDNIQESDKILVDQLKLELEDNIEKRQDSIQNDSMSDLNCEIQTCHPQSKQINSVIHLINDKLKFDGDTTSIIGMMEEPSDSMNKDEAFKNSESATTQDDQYKTQCYRKP